MSQTRDHRFKVGEAKFKGGSLQGKFFLTVVGAWNTLPWGGGDGTYDSGV